MLTTAGEDDLQDTPWTFGTEAKKSRSKMHLLRSASAERSSGWSAAGLLRLLLNSHFPPSQREGSLREQSQSWKIELMSPTCTVCTSQVIRETEHLLWFAC